LSSCSSSPFSRFISRLYLLGKYLVVIKKHIVKENILKRPASTEKWGPSDISVRGRSHLSVNTVGTTALLLFVWQCSVCVCTRKQRR
jgi:hypothetical protein